MTPCTALIHAPNEDDSLVCDLEEGHLGPHWDPEYGRHFTTTTTDLF